jgi:hypothetical protein
VDTRLTVLAPMVAVPLSAPVTACMLLKATILGYMLLLMTCSWKLPVVRVLGGATKLETVMKICPACSVPTPPERTSVSTWL